LQFGVGAGRCPILDTNCLPVLPNSPQEQVGGKGKQSRCKIRCGRQIQFVPRFGATGSRIANLRENVAGSEARLPAHRARTAAFRVRNRYAHVLIHGKPASRVAKAVPTSITCSVRPEATRPSFAVLARTAHFRAHGSFQPACSAMNVKGIRLKRPLMARLIYSISL